MLRTVFTLSLLAAGSLLQAADVKTIAALYDEQISTIQGELVPLVEAMPAAKFDFVPTAGNFKGVRTFAQQAKHIATVNYMVAAAALGQKAPVDLGTGENGPDSVRTREQVIKFLQDSFAYAHKAALSLTDKNQLDLLQSPFGENKMARAGLVAAVVSHSFDHYGQMVVYLRMNGVVPPASR